MEMGFGVCCAESDNTQPAPGRELLPEDMLDQWSKSEGPKCLVQHRQRRGCPYDRAGRLLHGLAGEDAEALEAKEPRLPTRGGLPLEPEPEPVLGASEARLGSRSRPTWDVTSVALVRSGLKVTVGPTLTDPRRPLRRGRWSGSSGVIGGNAIPGDSDMALDRMSPFFDFFRPGPSMIIAARVALLPRPPFVDLRRDDATDFVASVPVALLSDSGSISGSGLTDMGLWVPNVKADRLVSVSGE
mmetsp:Transcript_82183/g.145181  ORF Transcript_82183/g.145181 Transcript_82183/m.145181 type:complete len:243 (-) Transcript_82183:2605-3333(-)